MSITQSVIFAAMKFTIGKQEIDAEAFAAESFTSEKSGKKLRKMKIKFSVEGDNALDRYNDLEKTATKYGVVSDNPDGTSKTLWKSNVYLAQWQSFPVSTGGNWYEAIWSLEEAES